MELHSKDRVVAKGQRGDGQRKKERRGRKMRKDMRKREREKEEYHNESGCSGQTKEGKREERRK